MELFFVLMLSPWAGILLLFSALSAAHPIILIPLIGLLVVLWCCLLIERLLEWFGRWRQRHRQRLSSAAIHLEGVIIHAAPVLMLAGAGALALRLLLVGPW